MTVRKPLSDTEVEKLIDSGAKVKQDLKDKNNLWKVINLRIHAEMLNAVDNAVDRRVGITRTGWILEAIYEKIGKEGF